MSTIKSFVAATSIPAGLIRAVIRQCGGWESFKETAPYAASHGADSGFHGFIYHSETVPFAKRQMDNILDYADWMAADIGSSGALDMIASFTCLKGYSALDVSLAIHKRNDENKTEVLNALAWFALEEVARAYSDLLECAECEK